MLWVLGLVLRSRLICSSRRVVVAGCFRGHRRGGGNICLRIRASLTFRYLTGSMILIYFRLYNCHSRRPPSTWNESAAPTPPWHSSLAAYKAQIASRSFTNVTAISRMIPKPAMGTLKTSAWPEPRSLTPVWAVALIIPTSPTKSNGYVTNTVCGAGVVSLESKNKWQAPNPPFLCVLHNINGRQVPSSPNLCPARAHR